LKGKKRRLKVQNTAAPRPIVPILYIRRPPRSVDVDALAENLN
jgi:hypothetical protein